MNSNVINESASMPDLHEEGMQVRQHTKGVDRWKGCMEYTL